MTQHADLSLDSHAWLSASTLHIHTYPLVLLNSQSSRQRELKRKIIQKETHISER